MLKTHFKFLKKCVERNVAKKIKLKYTSNITYFPDTVWELWKHFKSVLVRASVDGFGKVNDFIRFPSLWDSIDKNIKKIDSMESKNLHSDITTTISILNIWHIPQFIEYILQSNYKKISFRESLPKLFDHNFLHTPHHFNLTVLEESFKEKIIRHFKTYQNKFSCYDWETYYGKSHLYNWTEKIKRANCILDECIKFMCHSMLSTEELLRNRKDFISIMDKLDKIRDTNWKKILPELYENTLKWRIL